MILHIQTVFLLLSFIKNKKKRRYTKEEEDNKTMFNIEDPKYDSPSVWITPTELPPHVATGTFFGSYCRHRVLEGDTLRRSLGCKTTFGLISTKEFDFTMYHPDLLCLRGEHVKKNNGDVSSRSYPKHGRVHEEFSYDFIIIIEDKDFRPFFMYAKTNSKNTCGSCDGSTITTTKLYYDDDFVRLLDFVCVEAEKQAILNYLDSQPGVWDKIKEAQEEILKLQTE